MDLIVIRNSAFYLLAICQEKEEIRKRGNLISSIQFGRNLRRLQYCLPKGFFLAKSSCKCQYKYGTSTDKLHLKVIFDESYFNIFAHLNSLFLLLTSAFRLATYQIDTYFLSTNNACSTMHFRLLFSPYFIDFSDGAHEGKPHLSHSFTPFIKSLE